MEKTTDYNDILYTDNEAFEEYVSNFIELYNE